MSTTGHLKVRVALAAALLLAVMVLMLGATSADAAFPGEDGDIAFTKDSFRQGSSGIFTIAPEGGAQDRIGPEYGYSPSWSADGERLVFVGSSGEDEMEMDQDIYVMNKDGGELQRVTSGRGFEGSPSFFPDGQRIAFAKYGRNGADIFTKTIGAPGSTRLTDTPGFEDSVAVSPDGTRIAFTKFNPRSGFSDLFVMDAVGGTEPDNLTETTQVDEFGADWSPDGLKIAFTSARYSTVEGRTAGSQEEGASISETLGLAPQARGASGPKTTVALPEESVEVSVINADGQERKDLTSSRAYDVLPAFSPSGDEIVYSKVVFNRRSEGSELFVMDSDTGANKRQITDTPRAFEIEADWQPVILP